MLGNSINMCHYFMMLANITNTFTLPLDDIIMTYYDAVMTYYDAIMMHCDVACASLQFIKAHSDVFSVSESGLIGLLPPATDNPCNSEGSAQSPASDVTMTTIEPERQSPMPMSVGELGAQTAPVPPGEGSVQAIPMDVEGEECLSKNTSEGKAMLSPTSRKRQGKKKDKK